MSKVKKKYFCKHCGKETCIKSNHCLMDNEDTVFCMGCKIPYTMKGMKEIFKDDEIKSIHIKTNFPKEKNK